MQWEGKEEGRTVQTKEGRNEDVKKRKEGIKEGIKAGRYKGRKERKERGKEGMRKER